MQEKTVESPLDCKDTEAEAPILWPPDAKSRLTGKDNQPWIFIRSIDTEAEAPTLWPPDAKSPLTGKDPNAWKDGGQEKGMTEDEIVGWHHQLNGHEFEQILGDSGRTGKPGVLQSMRLQSQTWLSDWTTVEKNYKQDFIKVRNLLFERYPKR